jgi:hypothetical protein
MKFLLIAKAPQAVTSATVQAARERGNNNIKSGITDCAYFFANGSRVVAITNADSAEALAERLLAGGWPPLESEIHPLVDSDKYLGQVIEALKKQGL